MTETDIRENASNARRREIADLRAEAERLRQELAHLASDSPHVAAKYWRQRQRALNDRDMAEHGLAAANTEIERLRESVEIFRARYEAEAAKVVGLCDACSCGTPGMDYQGPQEDCPLHGRPVTEVWGLVGEQIRRAEAAEAKIARVRLALNAGAAVGQATPIPDVWRAVMRALADPAQEQTGGEA